MRQHTMGLQRALLVGISGPSSSGKTTLSRLLRDILPSTYILHLDDFYLHDSQIPVHDGLQDWDCIESLDLVAFRKALEHIKHHGVPPPDLVSKEDQNAIGKNEVGDAEVQSWKVKAEEIIDATGWDRNRKIAIIDGFLLYSEDMKEIRELFDVKLFLTTDYDLVKKRREARTGYVTIEGFWEDPPGYVDNIVWPNYVRDHSFLFEKGDVNGQLDEATCKRVGVIGMPNEMRQDMSKCLEWAIDVLLSIIKQSKHR
jgi:nicotinamide/nicotinate riboside kinase